MKSPGVAAVLNVQYYVLLPLDPRETLELFCDQQGKDSTGHWDIYQSAKPFLELSAIWKSRDPLALL